jgi:hypothetical protein
MFNPTINEGFYNVPDNSNNHYWDPYWAGKQSEECYNNSPKKCMDYSNCGLCFKDGKPKCVPGDVHGPLFKGNCDGWMHTNYYDRHIFGEKVVTVSPPWSTFYSDYEVRHPSPVSRATL